MGFFRSSMTRPSSSSTNDASANSSSSVVALLKAKISQLEEQVSHKDSVIGDLQNGLEGNLRYLNKLEMSDGSARTVETSSTFSGSSAALVSPSLSHASGTGGYEENLVVGRLTSQLEDQNSQLASLQVQLEEQQLKNQQLHHKLKQSDQEKDALSEQISNQEKKIFDQANQIECLQALNETNTTIVSEMDLVRTTPSNNSNSPNQWTMYKKLQNLMETNNKMALEIGTATQEKQQALKTITVLHKDKQTLKDQINHLTKDLQAKEQKLTQIMQLETTGVDSLEELPKSVLPEIQQVLDIFPCNSNSSDDSNAEDPKLLQLSLKVCQSQLKQIQRDHELQLQKTVQQSVQLADSRAKVDTLQAKVEHYEGLMDAVLKNNPQVNGTVASSTTSKAARKFMAEDVGSPLEFTAESYKSPIQQTTAYTRNTLRRLSLPKFIRGKSPVKENSVVVNLAPVAARAQQSTQKDAVLESEC